MLPVLPRGNHVVLPIIQTKGTVDSNYNNDTAADGSQSELTGLRLENQALQLLLKQQLNKFISRQEEKDGTEVSSTRRADLAKKNTTPPIPIVQNKKQAQNKGRLADKAKAVHISTPEISVIPQRPSVFERLSENDSGSNIRVSRMAPYLLRELLIPLL